MKETLRQLNWLSALERGIEQGRPHFVPDNAIERVKTYGTTEDKNCDAEPTWKSGRQFRDTRLEVTAQECQRAFDQARKDHPDGLYFDLTEIAARELHIPGSRLRKLVPNPFR